MSGDRCARKGSQAAARATHASRPPARGGRAAVAPGAEDAHVSALVSYHRQRIARFLQTLGDRGGVAEDASWDRAWRRLGAVARAT